MTRPLHIVIFALMLLGSSTLHAASVSGDWLASPYESNGPGDMWQYFSATDPLTGPQTRYSIYDDNDALGVNDDGQDTNGFYDHHTTIAPGMLEAWTIAPNHHAHIGKNVSGQTVVHQTGQWSIAPDQVTMHATGSRPGIGYFVPTTGKYDLTITVTSMVFGNGDGMNWYVEHLAGSSYGLLQPGSQGYISPGMTDHFNATAVNLNAGDMVVLAAGIYGGASYDWMAVDFEIDFESPALPTIPAPVAFFAGAALLLMRWRRGI